MKTLTVLAFAVVLCTIGIAAAILGVLNGSPATVLDGLEIASLGVLFIYLVTKDK